MLPCLEMYGVRQGDTGDCAVCTMDIEIWETHYGTTVLALSALECVYSMYLDMGEGGLWMLKLQAE